MQAVNNFCRELGITRTDADIPLHKLDHHVRSDLEASSPRALAVLRPLLVVLTNLAPQHCAQVEAKVCASSDEAAGGGNLRFLLMKWIR